MNFRCLIGMHSWFPSGIKMKRKEWAKCELTAYYRSVGTRKFVVPMEKCLRCGLSREMYCHTVHSLEARNPFSAPPVYDCICGKGNAKHKQDWYNRVDQIRKNIAKRSIDND